MKDLLPANVWFQPASDRSLLVHFGQGISLDTHREIVSFLKLLEAEPVHAVLNLHPAYCSVLVKFDALQFSHAEVEALLAPYLVRLHEGKLREPRVREIPVCYGGEFGPDLAEVAAIHGISPDEVVRLHSAAAYTAYFLGFVPGFAYLGGLPAELTTPRLQLPRKSVPAGSVAIGGNQTGVYPTATPGGWRLIGKTPVKLFDATATHSSFFEIGDDVRFVAISSEEFTRMAAG